MKITKNFIRSSDRQEIYYEVYEADSPKAHVHILHGMAEHIGRYEEFARYLAGKGFIVSGHDHRGHGRTAERNNGTQGFFSDEDGFDKVVEDARKVIKAVQAQIGDYPLILFGHSMGSFVARRYIQLYSDEISRCVLSGTGGDPGAAGKFGTAFAKMNGKINGKDTPSKTLGTLTFGSFAKEFKDEGSAFAWLTRDSSEVAKYEADPMCGFVSTNQFFVDLFSGMALISKMSEVNKIRKNLPVLLISGADDPVGDKGKGVFAAAKQFKKAGMTDVAVYLAEGGRHELLKEIDKQLHYKTLSEWISAYD